MLWVIYGKVSRFMRPSLSLALVFVLGSCGSGAEQAAQKIANDTKQVKDFDNSLTFTAVTLEESDAKGKLWWKVKAKQASYSKDKKIAKIEEPAGELYQDGKVILKVSGKTGEFVQKDKKFFLRGNIKAIDLRDGLTVNGNEVEWQLRKNLLIVRDQVSGENKQLKMYAKQGKYNTKERRMELEKEVTAVTPKQDLFFKTEQLTWMVDQQTLSSDKPVQVDRFKNKVAVAKATGNQGTGDLKTKIVTLKDNAQVTFVKPTLQISSNTLVWNPDAQLVDASEPVTVVNSSEKVRMSGNQGRMDLQTNIATLTGNVQGFSERKKAQLNCNTLVWNLDTQQFEAEGNVAYRQEGKPPLNLTGPRAKGELQGQTVVISGGRVETQFIP